MVTAASAAPPAARATVTTVKPASSPVTYPDIMKQAQRAADRGQATTAIRHYRTALAARPNDPAAQIGIGWALLDLRQAKMAVRLFSQALARDPDNQSGLLGLGQAQCDLGNRAEAIAAYQRYVHLHPSGRDVVAAKTQLAALQRRHN
jgi:predicted Zn-dependent protease